MLVELAMVVVDRCWPLQGVDAHCCRHWLKVGQRPRLSSAVKRINQNNMNKRRNCGTGLNGPRKTLACYTVCGWRMLVRLFVSVISTTFRCN